MKRLSQIDAGKIRVRISVPPVGISDARLGADADRIDVITIVGRVGLDCPQGRSIGDSNIWVEAGAAIARLREVEVGDRRARILAPVIKKDIDAPQRIHAYRRIEMQPRGVLVDQRGAGPGVTTIRGSDNYRISVAGGSRCEPWVASVHGVAR